MGLFTKENTALVDVTYTSEQYARLHYQQYGLAVIDNSTLLDSDTFLRIVEDSERQRSHAWGCQHNESSMHASPQKNFRANFGATTYGWLSSQRLQFWLYSITSLHLQLSDHSSCFTYYERPMDFLACHTDHPVECCITFLLYLGVSCNFDETPSAGVYLMVGKHSSGQPKWQVRTRAGRILVMNGSTIPHWRPPLQIGERVSMISACFKLLSLSSVRK